MKRAHNPEQGDMVSEMVIVDTFTKLIFGEEQYSEGEETIIGALRAVEANVTLDDHREMGEYLRALGVGELIQLVSRVQARLAAAVRADMRPTRRAALARRVH